MRQSSSGMSIIYVDQRLISASAGSTRTSRVPPPACPAHPRERGEHAAKSLGIDLSTGLSPRARGTPRGAGGGVRPRRLIPASAGNTCRARQRSWAGPAHPRERGEHSSRTRSHRAPPGSSPRARGTPASSPQCSASTRLIPASAGNTVQTSPPGRASAAHPRERGEHEPCTRLGCTITGSSPRARGTRR